MDSKTKRSSKTEELSQEKQESIVAADGALVPFYEDPLACYIVGGIFAAAAAWVIFENYLSALRP
jgi:hypothetical protein